jgi:hypothetical protein
MSKGKNKTIPVTGNCDKYAIFPILKAEGMFFIDRR